MQLVLKKNEKIVFLIEDFQLIDDCFLQYLNTIIALGNIPGLFSKQEYEQIANEIRNSTHQNESFVENNISNYFSES